MMKFTKFGKNGNGNGARPAQYRHLGIPPANDRDSVSEQKVPTDSWRDSGYWPPDPKT